MAFCNKCGTELNDEAVFCSKCGTPVVQQSNGQQAQSSQQQYDKPRESYQYQQSYPPQQSFQQQQSYQPQQNYQNYQQSGFMQQRPHIDTTGIMIWSVINLFFCWPLSVFSFVTLDKVNKAATREEAERLFSTAKNVCGAATGLGIVFLLIVFSV